VWWQRDYMAPDWSPDYLANRLSDVQRRLSELRLGELDVRASLKVTYQNLDVDAARLLLLLPATPGPTFSSELAAALAGVPQLESDGLLDQLTLNHLVEPAGAGRYQMHDLIQLFAAERFAEAGAVAIPRPDPLSAIFRWYTEKLNRVVGALLVRARTLDLPERTRDRRPKLWHGSRPRRPTCWRCSGGARKSGSTNTSP
jgi:hypothetical protein